MSIKKLIIINVTQEEKNFVLDILRNMEDVNYIPAGKYCRHKDIAIYVDEEGHVTYSDMSYFNAMYQTNRVKCEEILDYKKVSAGIAQ